MSSKTPTKTSSISKTTLIPSQKEEYSPSIYSNYSYEKPFSPSTSSTSTKTSSSMKEKLKKFVGSLGQHPCAAFDREEAEKNGEVYVEGISGVVDFGTGRMVGSASRL